MGAGIGFLSPFLGLKNAGIIVPNESTIVALGDLHSGPVLLAVFGIVVTVAYMTIGWKGAIFFGMATTAVAGMLFGLIDVPTQVVSSVPSMESTFGQAIIHLPDIFTPQMLIVILTFFLH